MTTARDPLLNETLRVPVEERVVSNVPESVQLVYYSKTDSYALEGAFRTYNEQGMLGYEWRTMQTIMR